MSKRRGPDPLRGTPAIIGGLVAAVLVAIAPTFASACSPISYENSGSPRPLETNIAAALYRQAATVDLVVAESVTPVPLSEEVEDILRRQAFNGMPPSVGVTFRVLERLKGRSEDSFRLDALTPTSPDRLRIADGGRLVAARFGGPGITGASLSPT